MSKTAPKLTLRPPAGLLTKLRIKAAKKGVSVPALLMPEIEKFANSKEAV